MLPLLRITGDQLEHNFAQVIEMLAQEFSLTDEERLELIPSGRQAKFNSKVYWAKTYLNRRP
jgi:restriction system protein